MYKQFKNWQVRFLTNTFILLLALMANIAKGQMYMVSSMGSFPNTSSNASAINFKSNALCIDVQSGIAVLNAKATLGEFAINCTIDQKINTLGIKLYPNPAQSISKLKFISTPPLNEIFNVSIWNPEGYLMNTRQATGYQIFQGLLLNLNEISSGNYILKIESPRFIEAIKFIKIN
ncbi:MAG: Secretion system C-terminal sorting domain [Bacteroidota bacterium]|jgi:hypothetical protein